MRAEEQTAARYSKKTLLLPEAETGSSEIKLKRFMESLLSAAWKHQSWKAFGCCWKAMGFNPA